MPIVGVGEEAILATEIEKREESKAKAITFKCKFCERSKALDEMVVLTRFFPLIVACRDCAKKMQ